MRAEEVRAEGASGGKVEFSTVKREDTPPGNRGPNGKFLPGNCANPSGRPKTPEAFRKLARDASTECLQAVVDIARDPHARDSDRIRAAELVCAYGVGKPVQTVDLQGADAPRVILLDM